MGIKGIYGEIGPGKRVALTKLAVEKLEQEDRPLRIAIDISIWHFQTQAGKGGSNPAVRTLYYRLLRLLSLSIQPIFVFDGPNKPKFKRNKRVGSNGASLPNYLAKQVIKFFGFPCHNAPGEAEAECALLQREGIVDAVLSEDVDTLMFGCGLTFRNWSSESHNGAPTHVSMYEAEVTRAGKSGLDREGMVLVAMMSGGDYITEGIPGCGIKTACEAARAGFGRDLCRISKADEAGLQAWKQRLLHEIQTNESKFFRVKRKSFKIPEEFPDREALGYYTNPVVSTSEKIIKLKRDIAWDGGVDVIGLRVFVAEAFEWTSRAGARKYIRGLAPAMLVSKLLSRGNRRDSGIGDLILTALNEMDLVRSITGKRAHFCTDDTVELRLNFVPNDIVGLDLEAESDESEEYGRDGLAINPEEDDIENVLSNQEDQADNSTSPRKRGPSIYDPTAIDKVWVPQTIAKLGIPLKVEDYEETLRNPKKPVRKPAKPKTTAAKAMAKDMPKGALDKFVKRSKPGASTAALKDLDGAILPQTFLAPALENSIQTELTAQKKPSDGKTRPPSAKEGAPVSRTTRSKATKITGLSSQSNPWSKFDSNTTSSQLAVPITRHNNDTNTSRPKRSGFKVPSRIYHSPEPEILSQPDFTGRASSIPRDSKTLGSISKLQETPPKKRNSTITDYFGTPPSKRTIKSTLAKEYSTTPVPRNVDIMVPFSSQKTNRRLFTPDLSNSRPRDRTTRELESTSSPELSDLDDLFSSPAKGGSSFTKSFIKNAEVESITALQKDSKREVITIDSSPPASPTPLRRKKTTVLSHITGNKHMKIDVEEPLFPTERNTSPPSLSPILTKNDRGIPVDQRRRFLALRRSLEGTFKEVEDWDIKGIERGVWGVDEVEVVDLTGD